MGKTTFAVNLAANAAARGQPVLFASLEMSAPMIGQILLSRATGLALDDLRGGRLTVPDFDGLLKARQATAAWPLTIDDAAAPHVAAILARARMVKPALIVVDYLHLVAGGEAGARYDSITQRVTKTSRALKLLAIQVGAPVLALLQLSRAIEKRADKRPQLSDLRESGAIEQDADAVLFLYREAYYLERAEPPEHTPEHVDWQAAMARAKGRCEVIIGKQRLGPVTHVHIGYEPHLYRMADIERDDAADRRDDPGPAAVGGGTSGDYAPARSDFEDFPE